MCRHSLQREASRQCVALVLRQARHTPRPRPRTICSPAGYPTSVSIPHTSLPLPAWQQAIRPAREDGSKLSVGRAARFACSLRPSLIFKAHLLPLPPRLASAWLSSVTAGFARSWETPLDACY